LPSRDFVEAFVRVCGVGPDKLPAWLRAWELVKERALSDEENQASHRRGELEREYRLLTDRVEEALRSLRGLAERMGAQGHPKAALMLLENLIQQHTRLLGADHMDTRAAQQALAHWRSQAGDPGAAAVAYEELLADQVRTLGPDHPETLMTRKELAHWRSQAGDPRAAAAAYEELLADQVRTLGPDHPETLMTRKELARLWEILGVTNSRRSGRWRR
jgi:hypothetical protein